MTVRPTKVPGIPKPPASAGPELRRYLESLAEAVEIRLGRKGDPRDRAVTLRELIQSGLARELRATPFDPNNIGGPGLGFVADDPVPETGVPPQPTGFTAAGAYSVINLSWDFPIYTGPNHAHTEIYSYPSDNLASALSQGVIGVVSGRGYTDPVGSNVTRYYWIRHVNENGTVGPWNSGSGTVATTAPDVDHLLDVLSGSITSDELATSLRTELDTFQTLTDVNGNITARGYQTLSNVNNAINLNSNGFQTESNVNTLIGNNTNGFQTQTNVDDRISLNTNGFQTLTNVNNNITGRGFQTQTDVNSLISTATSGFQTAADVTNAINANSNGYQTASQVNSTVATAVVGVRGKILVWSSSGEYALNEVVRDNLGFLYVCISPVSTSTNDTLPTSFANPTTHWKLYGNMGSIEDSASKITQLNLLDGTSTSAAAQAIHGLNSILKDSNGNAVVSATNLSTMKTSVLNADGTARATATQVDYLNSQYVNPETGVANNVTLQQALNTSADNINGLRGEYTVKVDANGHVAGFGLANTYDNESDAATSSFYVNADRFAVLPDAVTSADAAWSSSTTYSLGARVTRNGGLYQARATSQNQPPPNATYWDDLSRSPFAVTSSGSIINGTYVPAGVYINNAMIKTASITAAQIGSVDADTITTGTLDVANLLTANSIDASKLVIDGSSLTSTVVNGVPTLQLGSVNVNTLTGSSISATIMSGTTVYANKLQGDVAVLLPFRSTSTVSVLGNTASGGGTVQVTSQQLPATSHSTNGHKAFASVTGWYDSTANKTYAFRLYMQDTAGGSQSLGSPISVHNYSGTLVMIFSGDKSNLVSAGQTITASGKSHTTTSVTYSTGTNTSSIVYTLSSGSAFTTSDTISTSSSSAWQLVGQTRFKANTNLYAQFALSGSLSSKTLGAVNMKLEVTRTGASGVGDSDNSTAADYIHEVSGFMMGAR